ncbi:MAG: DUF3047 domain-containing protein [Candidatus Omnitrophica bacterium]|nr:DUF3047 domain-containing protein [Candidatus Omnitrophota bacterium]
MRHFDQEPESKVGVSGMEAEPSPKRKKRFNIYFLFFWIFIGLTLIPLIYFRMERQPIPPIPFTALISDQVSMLPLLDLKFEKQSLFKDWQEHVFHEKTLYQIETSNGEDALHALSQGTSSLLFKEVHIKLSDRPFLTWEWNAIRFPKNKQNKILAAKSDNDYAARVYVAFKGGGSFLKEQASFLKGRIPLMKERAPFLADVIQYVWDDHFPEGTYQSSPYSRKTKIFVVRSGKINGSQGWVREKRDLVKDYEVLFRKAPRGDVIAVGIMSDSDNTGTEAEAFYKNLTIEKPRI